MSGPNAESGHALRPVAEQFPLYSGEKPTCPKCGYAGATTTYLPHGRCSHYGADYEVVGDDLNERLHRSCTNCGYSWDEATT